MSADLNTAIAQLIDPDPTKPVSHWPPTTSSGQFAIFHVS